MAVGSWNNEVCCHALSRALRKLWATRRRFADDAYACVMTGQNIRSEPAERADAGQSDVHTPRTCTGCLLEQGLSQRIFHL